jgi:prevent-host-death family protein
LLAEQFFTSANEVDKCYTRRRHGYNVGHNIAEDSIMRTSTIAEAKNNLSQLIHQLETGEAIHLTRYGKPVAVLISEHQYQRTIGSNKSLNSAILNWRSQLNQNDDIGFNDKELKALRKESSTGREFTWEE